MDFTCLQCIHLYGITHFPINLVAFICSRIILIPLHFQFPQSLELSAFIGLVGLGFILTGFVMYHILPYYKPKFVVYHVPSFD